MREVERICTKNDIEYFIIAGTLLGAVRHQGFIPWDDDVDFGLTRPNYDKLMSLLPTELGEDYYYINGEVSNVFPLINTRVMKKGTSFVEEPFKDLEMDTPLGVFVDVFPYDNVAEKPFQRKLQVFEASFLCKLLILKQISCPFLRIYGWKAKLVRFACRFIHYALLIFRVPRKVIVSRARKVFTRYNSVNTEMITNFTDTNPLEGQMSYSTLRPIKKIMFEGMPVPGLNDNEAYLRTMYGETFMQLPPVAERKMHKPSILELGNTAEEIIKTDP